MSPELVPNGDVPRWHHYLLPVGLTLLILLGATAFGYAIIQNHKNRRDINRIIRPSPEQAREGINRAIRQMTPAQAAAIFRKLPGPVKAELRGIRGARGPRGLRGQPGAPGRSGGQGATGRVGSPGRRGAAGPVAHIFPPRSAPRAPTPTPVRPVRPPRMPPLVPNLLGPFPPQGGLLPNGRPCPPRNPRC